MATASDIYLETMLRTATPQRLRLLVIGAGLRHLRRTREEWLAGRSDEGQDSLVRARDCLAELLSAVRPEASDLAARVQALYRWMIERTIELARSREMAGLDELIEILTEEQTTWTAVCEQSQPPAVASIDAPRTTVPAPLGNAPRRSTMSFEA